ncbi:ABC transporter substrate-binding protein [Cohnella thailandensis]|uniref:Sugar ABC transporter substrate-binding protein n=1 Tax=Cohnella thailandensis TaxID=557557 RepID=A0A841SU45_9BACL|nr:sugar ABC transporter substrate-binding protein [Cohnella thailandensis]MBB6634529.1 sugar ABC transporter substrate-binding protein [Cohnella thailandensis]MBP1972917.1 ABC-type glycerol-3-phosphate transport system substrate-binding protein [Cohnella thailandensis]
MVNAYRKPIYAALGMTLAAGLVLSGCSGGDNEGNAAPSASSAGSASAGGEAVSLDGPTVYGIKLQDMDAGGTLKGQYQGKKIVVATMAGDTEKALKDAASYFEKASGATVEVQSFPAESYMEKIQLDLQTNHSFDSVVMPVALIHGYAEGGLVQDLKPYIDNKELVSPNLDLDDFIPSLLDIYGNYKSKLVAFPYKPDAQIFFYRKDLFEDPKNQADFKAKTGHDLKVPETPEEMAEAAAFFTKSLNPESPVTYGYSTMADNTSSRWIWTNRLAAYGGKDVDKDFKPAFNNEAGLKSLQFAKQLTQYAPKELLTLGWDEANTLFANGEAAMMEQWPGLMQTVEADGSKVKGKVGYAVTPGGAPTMGGWSIAMTSSTDNADLTYKFIEYVTSKDMEVLKIQNKMDPTRTSNYMRPELQQQFPMYQTLLDSLTKGKIMADPDVPYVSPRLDDIMEQAVQSVLRGDLDPQKALDIMEKSFTEEIEGAGISG